MILGTELTNSLCLLAVFSFVLTNVFPQEIHDHIYESEAQNFSDTYSERTFSRIASNYQMMIVDRERHPYTENIFRRKINDGTGKQQRTLSTLPVGRLD